LDIFALPSYANEGVPQAILQAMLCGLPVVSTPVGSIQEAVQHPQTGLIVAAHDAEALRQALEQLLENSELRQVLGKAAREAALAKFGLEAMLDKMETVFTHARAHG
jgi:glycosyltransferase involved in cell wall biosynthesis